MSHSQISAREAAFHALLAALREEGFMADYLHQWQQEANPSSKDFHLAQQIAYGACRMRLALDEIACQLAQRSNLQIKRKERALLHTALFQCFFMDRIPLYAVVNETVALAKRLCKGPFHGFLNALLRNVERIKVELPQGDDIKSLSTRYSFPLFLVEQFHNEFGLAQTKTILEALNAPGMTMARCRTGLSDYPKIEGTPDSLLMCLVEDPATVSSSKNYYIQNATPATLMHHLSEGIVPPNIIVDLCAAPGGKLLAAHDLFPSATLLANDIIESKLGRLRENLSKYEVEATITCGPGEEYKAVDNVDLIIIDAPCSNSGVLNKRPEARWRLTKESVKQQEQQQHALLAHARSLLSPTGEIWYMTCSILKEENRALADAFAKDNGMTLRIEKTILPTTDGWDGGYGCALTLI